MRSRKSIRPFQIQYFTRAFGWVNETSARYSDVESCRRGLVQFSDMYPWKDYRIKMYTEA